jgi:hypothetical protein
MCDIIIGTYVSTAECRMFNIRKLMPNIRFFQENLFLAISNLGTPDSFIKSACHEQRGR